MSESMQTNPNYQPKTRLSKRGRRVVAASVGLAVAGGLAATTGPEVVDAYKSHKETNELREELRRPDALEEYLKGDSLPHDKVVRLESPGDMPPNAFAGMIDREPKNQRELTQQIIPQADYHYDPGLQDGEQVVVEKALVDPEAIKEYGVPDINNTGYNPDTEQIEEIVWK